MPQEQAIRIERVLEVILLRLLREHEEGLQTPLAYRIIEQTYRLPEDWRSPIPYNGDVYDRGDGAAQPRAPSAQTEPKWQNRVRFVVNRLRSKKGWMERGGQRGLWRLTPAGMEGAGALPDDLRPEERAILEPGEELEGAEVQVAQSAEAEGAVLGLRPDRVLRAIVLRRGQRRFRDALLRAYDGRCAMTGCDAVDALEAAHLIGAAEGGRAQPSNGLLLRADLHTLFDLDRIGVHPERRTIHLCRGLRGTAYAELDSRPLRRPAEAPCEPDGAALSERWRRFAAGQ